MSITRRIVLSVFALVVVAAGIVLGPDFLWLKIVLAALFILGLFFPANAQKETTHSDTTPHE